jgi:uncharacterized protein YjiS (DUF1127 family)
MEAAMLEIKGRTGVLSSLRYVWRRGRTRRALTALDDCRLKDIGLPTVAKRPLTIVHEPTQRWLDSLR